MTRAQVEAEVAAAIHHVERAEVRLRHPLEEIDRAAARALLNACTARLERVVEMLNEEGPRS